MFVSQGQTDNYHITWSNVDHDVWRAMVSLGCNDLLLVPPRFPNISSAIFD